MARRKTDETLKLAGVLGAIALMLVALQFLSGTFSVLSAQGIGNDYIYNYNGFSEDFVTFSASDTTNDTDAEKTWLFTSTDKPQANVSTILCGIGGLKIDTVNSICNYNIQAETRLFYIYGNCTMDNAIQAITIVPTEIGGIKGVTCTFPPITAGLEHTYKANLRIEFKEPCAVDTFQPSTCDKAWYMAPFIQGKHIQGKDYNNCATHRCQDDVQWLNIVVVLLAIAVAIILIKRRFGDFK